MDVIRSLENNKVKYWTKLNNKKYRDQEDLFIIEGEHLIIEANKKNIIKEVVIREDKDYNYDNKYYVSNEVMKKISNLNTPPEIIAICKKIKPREIQGNVLILDSIQDPGNLGTIIRSSVAFNIDTLVLGNNTVDLYNEKVLRASEGNIFNLNIINKDIISLIQELKEKDYKILGTKVTNGKNVKDIHYNKYAIIVGNEGNGVSNEVLNNCDEFIYIPMNSSCESLNVAIASSIILYELAGDKYE